MSYYFKPAYFCFDLLNILESCSNGKAHYQNKKLDIKTFPLSNSNSGTQRCNGWKSHLSKLLLFVPNQRLPYKLVD